MYLFLFFALPILYYIFTILKNPAKELETENTAQDSENPKTPTFSKGVMIVFGAILSVIYCFVDFFTAYAYRAPVYGLFTNFTYYFLSTILVPMLVCAVPLFLLSKDSWIFKLQTYTPMLIGFYAIFLPYEVISKNDTFDFFLLFMIPVIYSTMFFLQEYGLECIGLYINKKLSKKSLWISVSAILLAILIPAMIYDFYFTKLFTPLAVIFSVVFMAGTFLLHYFSKQIQSKFQYQ